MRLVSIKETSHVIGQYLDHDIHERLITDEGRHFTFESIAVVDPTGQYLVDFPKSTYMVFQGLIYREVQPT